METQFNRITPENITDLKENEVFVFGSNEAGFHGGGAAKLAHNKFGAQMYKGEGLFGKSYAIPTKDKSIETLPVENISKYVDKFIEFASIYPGTKFFVTEIGCGLAGYSPKDIAPLFKETIKLENIHLPERFWKIINE